ncbi:unnamed protein product [Caenorhabditis auriculariae]|uniref:Uncharacterized protein n=1 Tax=Caenorhabditis auriculariae TaxID=2777116 RepID=A0A8S1HBJ8_9PELO|nr:unnamed protein product [Caenorhabditis auriculariae]
MPSYNHNRSKENLNWDYGIVSNIEKDTGYVFVVILAKDVTALLEKSIRCPNLRKGDFLRVRYRANRNVPVNYRAKYTVENLELTAPLAEVISTNPKLLLRTVAKVDRLGESGKKTLLWDATFGFFVDLWNIIDYERDALLEFEFTVTTNPRDRRIENRDGGSENSGRNFSTFRRSTSGNYKENTFQRNSRSSESAHRDNVTVMNSSRSPYPAHDGSQNFDRNSTSSQQKPFGNYEGDAYQRNVRDEAISGNEVMAKTSKWPNPPRSVNSERIERSYSTPRENNFGNHGEEASQKVTRNASTVDCRNKVWGNSSKWPHPANKADSDRFEKDSRRCISANPSNPSSSGTGKNYSTALRNTSGNYGEDEVWRVESRPTKFLSDEEIIAISVERLHPAETQENKPTAQKIHEKDGEDVFPENSRKSAIVDAGNEVFVNTPEWLEFPLEIVSEQPEDDPPEKNVEEIPMAKKWSEPMLIRKPGFNRSSSSTLSSIDEFEGVIVAGYPTSTPTSSDSEWNYSKFPQKTVGNLEEEASLKVSRNPETIHSNKELVQNSSKWPHPASDQSVKDPRNYSTVNSSNTTPRHENGADVDRSGRNSTNGQNSYRNNDGGISMERSNSTYFQPIISHSVDSENHSSFRQNQYEGSDGDALQRDSHNPETVRSNKENSSKWPNPAETEKSAAREDYEDNYDRSVRDPRNPNSANSFQQTLAHGANFDQSGRNYSTNSRSSFRNCDEGRPMGSRSSANSSRPMHSMNPTSGGCSSRTSQKQDHEGSSTARHTSVARP